MKRKIIKTWDPANGRLQADYFRIDSHQVTHVRFQSPLFMRTPLDAKHNMRMIGAVGYFGRAFIETIHKIINQ